MSSTQTDLMTGQPIVAQNEAALLGCATGWQPVSLNRSRLAIAGHAGTGKSTILHSNPRAIILDIEKGGRTVADPQAPRWPDWKAVEEGRAPVPDFQAFTDKIRQIVEAKRTGRLPNIDMVGIDTFDALFELWKRATCKLHELENINDYRGGYGKGYDLGCETLFGLLDEVNKVGMGWCVLIHLVDRTVKVGQVDVTQTSLAIPEKFQGYFARVLEHMLFMDFGTETIQKFNTVPINGIPTQIAAGSETRSIRRLMCTPGTMLRGSQANDPKVRVPIIPEIIVPKKGAWALLQTEYDAALKRMFE